MPARSTAEMWTNAWLLGHGSFAKVYLARGRRDKQLYALKAVG